jgi:deleted-in-malignant-brain-tumors protein 1
MQYYFALLHNPCTSLMHMSLCFVVNCSNGDVRLVGGLSEFEGRVEVCWNETWGTVCDDFWSGLDARVVCRQLGYTYTDAESFGNAHFGQGSGPILLDDVTCGGNEQSLISCRHRGIGNENCDHNEDAGIRCT